MDGVTRSTSILATMMPESDTAAKHKELPVLRAILLYLSRAEWARRLVTGWGFARKAASRFVSGDTLDEALDVIRSFNKEGIFVTLDRLGENVNNPLEASEATDIYINVLDRLHEEELHANVSVKLTALGLRLEDDVCLDNVRRIAARAAQYGIMIRIDMEDSPTVDATLDIQRTLYKEGLSNIGMVIQSYLYRSSADVDALMETGTPVRLCKGAYNEPADVAYPRKADVDAAYDRLTEKLIDACKATGSRECDASGRVPPIPGIATHDEKRIDHAIAYGEMMGLPKRALEFQMLYGIRSDLQRRLAQRGYPVRIYVPFGTEWYPYYVRRLAERPANVWFFISNFFKR